MSLLRALLLCAACSAPHVRESAPSEHTKPIVVKVESATPGPVGECKDQSDCTLCAFAEPFVSEADCACWGCPHVPMGVGRCNAITASHRSVCESWERSHACPPTRECDTMSIPSCAGARCGATRLHLRAQ